MPVYVKMVKDKKTGKMVEKLINGQRVYYIRTYVEDETGHSKQIKKSNKKWIGRDGKVKAQEEENRLKNQNFIKSKDMTIEQLAERYFKHMETKIKTSTMVKKKSLYSLYIRPHLGYKKVFKLSNADVINFHDELDKVKIVITSKDSKRDIGEYPLSVRYKQNIHVILNSILNFGCKYIDLDRNVAFAVGNYTFPKGSKRKELNYLTKDEFNRVIEQVDDEKYKDFLTLLFYTGMRRGELLALKQKNIDLDNNTIKICESLNPDNGSNATVPKTNKSNRIIKIMEIVKSILLKYQNKDCIFGLETINPTTLQRKCDLACKKANIDKNIRIHDLRHSFASMCVNANVPIEILSEYLGHENKSTTWDTYSHLYPNSQNKLVDTLENMVQI